MINNLVLGLEPWAGSWGEGCVAGPGVSPRLPQGAPVISSSHYSSCFPAPRDHSLRLSWTSLAGPAEGALLLTPSMDTHMLVQNCFRSRLNRSMDLVQTSCAVRSNGGVGP